MTHVLVIGNSHTAALRAALNHGPGGGVLPWGALRIRFAAAPEDATGRLELRGEHLVVPDEETGRLFRRFNGADRFDLAETDAVVFCGGLLMAHAVTRLYGRARWFPLPSARGLPADLPLVSEAVALASLRGTVPDLLLWPLLAALAARGRPRLIVLQGNRHSRDVVGSGKAALGLTRVAEGPDAAALSDFYDRAAAAIFAPLAQVILQPQDTRADHFFTDPVFCRGAARLAKTPDVPQPPTDFLHGNAAYGARLLDAIAATLA
jgi:hypothetical protein